MKRSDGSRRGSPRQGTDPKDIKGDSTKQLHVENDEAIIPANPYTLAPTFSMALRGEWDTGGVLEFFDGDQLLDFIKLPPAPWAILANLFLAAIHSQTTHWLDAFVMTKRLITSLDERRLTSIPTGQTVFRLTSRIRSKLAVSNARKLTGNLHLTGQQWAEQVLENSRSTGYRIGLPPDRLWLVIGEIHYESESERGIATKER